jgi:hypothetical protein
MKRVYSCPFCNQKLLINSSTKALSCVHCKVPLTVSVTDDQNLITNIINYSVVIATATILLHDFDSRLEFILLLAVGIYALLSVFFERKLLEINQSYIQGEIGRLEASIRPYKKFLNGDLGILDLLIEDSQLKRITGLDGFLSSLLKIHYEKIGGLTYEEQLQGIIQTRPNLDMKKLLLSEIKKIDTEMDDLKKYLVNWSWQE